MLDFLYYPVSAILWFWHRLFASILGQDSSAAWVLAVVFIVVTLRLLLFVPYLKQMRFQQTMLRLQPRIKSIQRTYANERRKQSAELQKLQREHGVNPLLGCLPALVQGVVFIALYHVLRSFDRTGPASHVPFLGTSAPLTTEQNAHTPNYVFGAGDVQSFLHAKVFGAPLSATIATAGNSALAVAAIAIPLMIVAAVMTHLTARAAIARQVNPAPQAALLNRLSLWVFPAFAVVGGPVLPVTILLYWATSYTWSLGQQHFVHRRLDAEQRLAPAQRPSGPKPGAKPVRTRR